MRLIWLVIGAILVYLSRVCLGISASQNVVLRPREFVAHSRLYGRFAQTTEKPRTINDVVNSVRKRKFGESRCQKKDKKENGISNFTGLLSISKRSGEYSVPYEKWSALALKRATTIDALRLIDNDIHSTLQDLQTSTDEARFAIRKTTKLSNVRSFTYGITTILASFFLIEFALDGVDRTSLTRGQQLNVAGNLGFAYGYGGPYILDGQLSNGDPGCGVEEIRDTLGPIWNMLHKYSSLYDADGSVGVDLLLEDMEDPIIARTMIKEMVDSSRTSVFCLISQSGDEATKLTNLLGRLETALNTRMDLITSVISILEEENENAALLGHDTKSWPYSFANPSLLY